MSDSTPFVSEDRREYLAARGKEYRQQLKGSVAEAYLKEDRGFTDATINHFGFGYVGTSMKGDQMHSGRIVIPYYTRNGVVALRSRSMPRANGGDDGMKYLPWMTGDVTRPYNTNALDVASEVYLTEGELDCVTAYQMGLFAVAISGVANWKSVYKPLFRYRHITILADADDDGQGQKFAQKVAKELGGASIVSMPTGHDLNSAYVHFGEEFMRKHLGLDEDEE